MNFDDYKPLPANRFAGQVDYQTKTINGVAKADATKVVNGSAIVAQDCRFMPDQVETRYGSMDTMRSQKLASAVATGLHVLKVLGPLNPGEVPIAFSDAGDLLQESPSGSGALVPLSPPFALPSSALMRPSESDNSLHMAFTDGENGLIDPLVLDGPSRILRTIGRNIIGALWQNDTYYQEGDLFRSGDGRWWRCTESATGASGPNAPAVPQFNGYFTTGANFIAATAQDSTGGSVWEEWTPNATGYLPALKWADSAPNVVHAVTFGLLPAATDVYVKISLVIPETGETPRSDAWKETTQGADDKITFQIGTGFFGGPRIPRWLAEINLQPKLFLPVKLNVWVASVPTGDAAPADSSYQLFLAEQDIGTIIVVDQISGPTDSPYPQGCGIFTRDQTAPELFSGNGGNRWMMMTRMDQGGSFVPVDPESPIPVTFQGQIQQNILQIVRDSSGNVEITVPDTTGLAAGQDITVTGCTNDTSFNESGQLTAVTPTQAPQGILKYVSTDVTPSNDSTGEVTLPAGAAPVAFLPPGNPVADLQDIAAFSVVGALQAGPYFYISEADPQTAIEKNIVSLQGAVQLDSAITSIQRFAGGEVQCDVPDISGFEAGQPIDVIGTTSSPDQEGSFILEGVVPGTGKAGTLTWVSPNTAASGSADTSGIGTVRLTIGTQGGAQAVLEDVNGLAPGMSFVIDDSSEAAFNEPSIISGIVGNILSFPSLATGSATGGTLRVVQTLPMTATFVEQSITSLTRDPSGNAVASVDDVGGYAAGQLALITNGFSDVESIIEEATSSEDSGGSGTPWDNPANFPFRAPTFPPTPYPPASVTITVPIGQLSEESTQLTVPIAMTVPGTDVLLGFKFIFEATLTPKGPYTPYLLVYLMKAGAIVGSPKIVVPSTDGFAQIIVGGASDPWIDGFVPADFASGFGIAIFAQLHVPAGLNENAQTATFQLHGGEAQLFVGETDGIELVRLTDVQINNDGRSGKVLFAVPAGDVQLTVTGATITGVPDIPLNFDDSALAPATDVTSQLTSMPPPKASDICWLPSLRKMAYVDNNNFPSAFLLSDTDDPANIQDPAGIFSVEDDDGGSAIGMRELRSGEVLAIKSNGGFSVDTSNTSPSDWSPKRRWAIYGPPSGLAIGIGKDFLTFPCQEGAQLYESGELVSPPISSEIETTWKRINWAAKSCIWTVVDEDAFEVKFGVPLDGATEPTHELCVNYRTGWGPPEVLNRYGKIIITRDCRRWSINKISAKCATVVERTLVAPSASQSTAYPFLNISRTNGKVTATYDDSAPMPPLNPNDPFMVIGAGDASFDGNYPLLSSTSNTLVWLQGIVSEAQIQSLAWVPDSGNTKFTATFLGPRPASVVAGTMIYVDGVAVGSGYVEVTSVTDTPSGYTITYDLNGAADPTNGNSGVGGRAFFVVAPADATSDSGEVVISIEVDAPPNDPRIATRQLLYGTTAPMFVSKVPILSIERKGNVVTVLCQENDIPLLSPSELETIVASGIDDASLEGTFNPSTVNVAAGFVQLQWAQDGPDSSCAGGWILTTRPGLHVAMQVPDVYDDNGAGIDHQYEPAMATGGLEQQMTFAGYRVRAVGNGNISIAAQTDDPDVAFEPKIFLLDNTKASLLEGSLGFRGRYASLLYSNGRKPGSWFALQQHIIYARPRTN